MKKIVIIGFVIILVLLGVLLLIGTKPAEAPAPQKNVEKATPPPAATPPSSTQDTSFDITFEHFFKTLSASERDCLVRSIGDAKIQAWIKDPNLEPSTEETAKMDACLAY